MKLVKKIIKMLEKKDMYISEIAIDIGGHRLILTGILQAMEELDIIKSYMLGRTKMYKLKEKKIVQKKDFPLIEYIKIEEVVDE